MVSTADFEYNFKSLYKPLCLFSLQFQGAAEDAEDIVQQAFADVWEKIRAGETILNLKAYLFQAVRNRSLSFASRASIYETTEQLPDKPDLEPDEQIALADKPDLEPDEQIALAERDARLWSAIDRLPPERRRIFLLSKRDGMKYQEIADLLHISIKTVENQMSKALKTLRDTAIRIYMFFFG